MTRFDEQEQKVTISISMIMTFLFPIDFGCWHVKLFVCHSIVFVMYYVLHQEDTISLHTFTTVVVVVWPEAIRHHIGVTDERTCGNFLQCDGNIV